MVFAPTRFPGPVDRFGQLSLSTDLMAALSTTQMQLEHLEHWRDLLNHRTTLPWIMDSDPSDIARQAEILDSALKKFTATAVILRDCIGVSQSKPSIHTTFSPIPPRLWARPSVEQQLDLLISAETPSSALASNYYHSLVVTNNTPTIPTMVADEEQPRSVSWADSPPQPSTSSRPSSFHPDMLNLQELQETIDQELAALYSEGICSPPADPSADRYGMRLNVRLTGFTVKLSLADRLDKLLAAGKMVDPHFAIRAYAHANQEKFKPITRSTHFKEVRDIRQYFHPTIKDQKGLLQGHVHVESSFRTCKELITALQDWSSVGNHRILPLQCQSEETSIIGFFIHSSLTLYRLDLQAAIKNHPDWETKGNFEFAFLHRDFYYRGESVPTLCVEVSRSAANRAISFFSDIYDGENSNLPLGIKLLFCATQYNAASDEDRHIFFQEQKAYLEQERTSLIKGFAPLQSQVRLGMADTPSVSIRGLILLLRDSTGKTIFQGVDRQHVETQFILLKYPVDHSPAAQTIFPLMEAQLKALVLPEDHPKIFDSSGGLSFAPAFANYRDNQVLRNPTQAPLPTATAQNASVRAKLRSSAVKRTQPWSPPRSPTTRSSVKQSRTINPTVYSTRRAPPWVQPIPSGAGEGVSIPSISNRTMNTLPGIQQNVTAEVAALKTSHGLLLAQQELLKGQVDHLDDRVSRIDSKLDTLLRDNNSNFAALFQKFGIGDGAASCDSDMDLDVEATKRKRDDTPNRAACTPSPSK